MATSTIKSPYALTAVALYAPTNPLDVHTDTTVTLTQEWSNFSTIVFYFLQTSSTSSYRSILTLSQQGVGQSAWHAISQGSTIGGVKIGYPSGEYNKIKIMETSLSGLYLYRIWGTN